jgi:uncharacterized phage-associated protein
LNGKRLFIKYKDGYDLVSRFKDNFATDELSKVEISILDKVTERYADKSYWELIELVHGFPEWNKNAEKLNTSLILEKRAILKALEKSDKK